MSTWIAKLKEAKELFDGGLISEVQYNQLRDEAFSLRDGGTATTEDEFDGETQTSTGADTVEDELSSDTLAGVTQFVPEAQMDKLASDPLSGDTLAGGTQFVPDYEMEADSDILSGVTMMGRAVTLTDANIETLSSGTLFNNRYSILKLLGKGGMGVVYKALDIHTGVEVALKVLRNHVKDDAAYIQSLKDEVARGLRWSHPSFLQIRHLEVESVQPFVVMELMDRDAKEWLDSHGGQVAAKEVLSVVQSIASALRVMHEDGHIHLDLKPENVLLKDGKAKLSDFGISSSLKNQRGGHSGSGTLFYAPPEQMDGGQCDVRTDVYALGMMTGQLFAGRFPFALKKAEEVQEWHRSGSRDFSYLSGKVAQVLGKACAVSMDDRYRTVNEFIGELEKALDHKPWYPPSLPLESVHPSLVLVDSKEHTMDVAKLLPQGVLTPSLTLKGGKVLMQSNPFALAEVGVMDYLSSKLKPVVEDILSGSDAKLSALSKQDSATESQLAMLAARAEISERSIQRRLYYASDSLSTLEDRLTLAYTHRTAMKDVKSANDLMESIGQGTIQERLEVTRHQRWLELDERGVQRNMFAIEEDCKRAEDWQGLASAQVSLFNDWNSADAALAKQLLNQRGISDLDAVLLVGKRHQPLNLKRAIEALLEPIKLYGLRNPLKEAGDRLDNLADSPADYAKISEFWKTVGAGDAASKAEEERQALFRTTIQSLVQRLAKLDAHIEPPSGTLSESDVVGYERKVREQERFHGDVADLKRKLSKTDVTLNAPSGVLTTDQVTKYKGQVSEQVGLYQQVQEMSPIARNLNLDGINWTRPYTPEQVNQRREEIATYAEYAEQMETMLATANQLGWNVSQSGRVEAERVSTFAEQLAEQQRLSEQLGKLRAEADALGGTLRLPKYPLTVEKIAGVEAQMPSVRVEAAVREQVSLAKSIGWDLEMPAPPYTPEMVEDLRVRVVEQQGFKAACENEWGLKHPRLPMTQGDVETFKAAVNQQASWNQEIESLYNQAQASNKPKPPYTEQEVTIYRQATSAKLSRRRNISLGVGSVTALVFGFVGFQWYEAQSLESRARAIGWDIDVPVFEHESFVESVSLQESLSKSVENLESRAKVIGLELDIGDCPYSEEQVTKYEREVSLQESLSKRVEDVESQAKNKGWDLDVGDCPYSEEQVKRYEEDMAWLNGGGSFMYRGYMYHVGKGVNQNYDMAAELYKQGCDGGDALACTNLGVMYDRGEGVSQDYDTAVEFFKQGCDGGNAPGCYNLGKMYRFGRGVSLDYDKAAELYKQSCDGGEASGCSDLGLMYDRGEGVSQDYDKALDLYKEGCFGKDGVGCTGLGYMYHAGKGVNQSYDVAAELYKMGCKLGKALGCYNLGVMYGKGEGVSQDYGRAAELYKQGCDGGQADACSAIGNYYRVGRGVSKNTSLARKYLRQGCDGGHQWGCDKLKGMGG